MKLSFYGATHAVTGSCHFLQACGKNILIDCGMQQGKDENNPQELPVAANQIDYVLLTHAHIDHSGRLPLLSKLGFSGQVVTTDATADLCRIMLRDSAHIQEFEAEWRNRKGKRSGKKTYEPLYTMQDAENILAAFTEVIYGQVFELCPGISVRFGDIGHLLGSASIEIWVEESGEKRKLVFSGDIGNINQPLIRDPGKIAEADYVITESTYGDRLHNPPPDYAQNLAEVIQRTFDRGGNVLIPSFAVGRTQEMLYFIRHIKAKGLVKGHDGFEVFVDSPLAIEATTIFRENHKNCYDAEATELVSAGINPIAFEGLHTSVTAEDSKAINRRTAPAVIISASGMCEAGRIKHHLKHNLWRSESTVVFVGYQAEGSTGRALLDGAKTVKLFGEEITVRAEIVRLEGVSGHADQKGMLDWLSAFGKTPKKVFVVHGQEEVCDHFAALITQRLGLEAVAPNYSACYDLVSGAQLDAGIRPQKKSARRDDTEESGAYANVMAQLRALERVVVQNKYCSNKELQKLASQIQSLTDKWKF
ncbi:MAG: MBL fold metallo-hydrolase [Clostridia bacterium]|nr:MBL fold metallo-hydrolase [Clostridia bacterium]